MTTVSPLQVGSDHLQDLEATINHWIHLELCASCIYLSTSFYLDHDELALRNIATDFPHQAHKERDRAEKLTALAGPTRWLSFPQHSKKADCGDWESRLDTLEHRLHLDQNVISHNQNSYKAAIDKNGQVIHVTTLNEWVKSIKDLGDHVTSLHKMGPQNPCMAEYLFDKDTPGQW